MGKQAEGRCPPQTGPRLQERGRQGGLGPRDSLEKAGKGRLGGAVTGRLGRMAGEQLPKPAWAAGSPGGFDSALLC